MSLIPPNSLDFQVPFLFTVSAIRAVDLPKVQGLNCTRNINGRFYCAITIDEKQERTEVARRGSSPEWDKSFSFYARPSSTLTLVIYARRRIRKDQHIGVISDTISTLCSSILNGGTQDFTRSIPGESKARVKLRITVEGNKEITIDALTSIERASPAVRAPSKAVGTALEGVASAAEVVQGLPDASRSLFGKMKIFCDLMDTATEVQPYSRMALMVISVVQKIFENSREHNQQVQKLVATMDSFYNIVSELKVKPEKIHSQQGLLRRIAQQTTECCYFIREYANTEGFAEQAGRYRVSATGAHIDKYCAAFADLEREFHGRLVGQAEIAVMRTLEEMENYPTETHLDDMPYANGAGFDMSKRCHPGTRTSILDEITDWINAEHAPRVLLLSGAAGSGKSTIAHTIAHRFKNVGRLGASFSFIRGQTDRGPDKLFATIARDLADFDQHIRRAVGEVVHRDKDPQTTSNVRTQFERLILEPIKTLLYTGPIVIAIDALDESGDSTSREELLQVLVARAEDLPANFRILLTSRPEPDIERLFRHNDRVVVKRMRNLSPSSTEADLKLYIHARLSDPDLDDIDDECMRTLVSKSEGLFQWAYVACGFIKGMGMPGSTSKERYDLLAQGTTGKARPLDRLYRMVLSHFFQAGGSLVMDRFKFVMGLLLAAFEPLSAGLLNELLRAARGGNPGFKVKNILDYMAFLLSGVTGDEPVRPLHASFRDFLLDPSRSVEFCVDTSQGHRDLILASLYIMKNELSFNICGLESSYVLNQNIPNLADRIQKHIPARLSYSCRFWAEHLRGFRFAIGPILSKDVEVILTKKLLFWLEVMSLLGTISRCAQALSFVADWSSGTNTGQISRLASDAQVFVDTFAFPMSQSAPHVYLSALPFTPPTSTVFRSFHGEFSQTIFRDWAGATGHWPVVQDIIHATVPAVVSSLVFSPDGSRFVTGLQDRTIRLWDARTGAAVREPLQGHKARVQAVAFSPDGSRIVSGSVDKTIRIWDMTTGAIMCEPLEGHTGWVQCVAFSPNGSLIVSGSIDTTIRIWDAATGAALGEPLKGHIDDVLSISFSPDGSRIVSSSIDATIRIWDVASGAALGKPLKGHTSWIRSVVFSPDGLRIASGSDDKTIRIWDSATGAAVGQPFEGHTNHVQCIAFSPDGSHVVSGSIDATIRVWNSATGIAVGEPLEGQADEILSIVFSPDGSHIVSGSKHATIRIWDVAAQIAAGEHLEGHTDCVHSVAFSSDSAHVVSSSSDKTIRLWDATMGNAVGEPFRGHTGHVQSVVFSPNSSRIVSGSRDSTIRVWDTTTGTAVGEPFEADTLGVQSIAFSPDGSRIVAGLDNGTLRVWDTETGAAVGEPFVGHAGSVHSVAFSPDSSYIVSGSSDKTIRIWDATTGASVDDPLEGHVDQVQSVAFSPDGLYIVSASRDWTIRLWDTATGAAAGQLLEGHTSSVNSVAFSPDGSHIVSGSSDKTIRLWDTVTGATLGEPFEGHTDSVMSVAFSPDGLRIVSGSRDTTVRVWDASMSLFVGEAPSGHAKEDKASSATENDGGDLVTLESITNTDLGRVESLVSAPHHVPILFSSRCEHALPHVDDLYDVPSTPLQGHYRTSQHLTKDGWIVGPASQLLFWVPSAYHDKLWPDGRLRRAIGREYLQLDLSQFTHGSSWTDCYRPSAVPA